MTVPILYGVKILMIVISSSALNKSSVLLHSILGQDIILVLTRNSVGRYRSAGGISTLTYLSQTSYQLLPLARLYI